MITIPHHSKHGLAKFLCEDYITDHVQLKNSTTTIIQSGDHVMSGRKE